MSFDPAIRAERLGKLYQLGTTFEPRLTLREQINRLALSPYHRFRSVLRGEAAHISGDDLWALKDVSFSVPYGEVVGVIGRNGAGKSTLLKILSRITEPTKGRAAIRGRVGFAAGSRHRLSLRADRAREHLPEWRHSRHDPFGGSRASSTRLSRLQKSSGFSTRRSNITRAACTLRLAFAVAAHLQPESCWSTRFSLSVMPPSSGSASAR